MELPDKTSYLMMFGALLLARCRQTSLSRALSVAPLSGRTRRLADQLAASAPARSAEEPVYLGSGGLHGPAYRPIAKIESQDVRLRCPRCGNEGSFTLDRAQRESLHVRGHLESYCGSCGASNLWEPTEPTHSSQHAEPTGRAVCKILVVDQDPATATLLEKLCGAWEAQVTVARSGKEAMQKLTADPFDLLLCELRLEDMNGQDLFDFIRNGHLIAPEQVIFIGDENAAVVRNFLDASGCGYCRKPIRFAELSRQAEAWFRADSPEEPPPSKLII